MSSNYVSVAHIITGSDEGIRERLCKMKNLIVNIELINENSLLKLWY